ncbi:signal peptidase II [Bradyrhizobium quebecense]|uniref:Lipoprotein signal peptidase n=1 Tax=Bradyrhizobium quebecense TaxID=2748629 RepID=A0A974A9T4_9BRAD|nr:signal peptidase II [Bradyrhizobium quebecense]UGA41504.1 signal peptidase II [Bradyrhizobium quebecense]
MRVAISPWPNDSGARDRFVRRYESSRIVAFCVALAMLALDQLTKLWALRSLETGATLELPGPIDLTLVFNRSNAFGLIPDYGALSRWALASVGLAAAAALLGSILRRSTSTINAFGFALIGAGAAGNALDRLRLGAVVDLFDASKLRFVWIFNVADVSIDLGIALVLLAALLPSLEAPKTDHGNN